MSRKVKAEDAKIGNLYKLRGWGGVFVCIDEGSFLKLGTSHFVDVSDEKVKELSVTLIS